MRRLTLITLLPFPAYAADLPPVSIEKIAEGVYLHKSWQDAGIWGLVDSNGLAIQTGDGVVLIDTAWGIEETETLLSLIEGETGQPVIASISTHGHADRMGGIEALTARGIASYALPSSSEMAVSEGGVPASNALDQAATDHFERLGIEWTMPGAGHTLDNIVVYHPQTTILFGGCLIRAMATTGMGNTADGDTASWAAAAQAALDAFPATTTVVPGHGDVGGRELIDHTSTLAAPFAEPRP